VGIEILANAGFDPNHMPGFFERLQEAYRYMDSSLPELLRTHPVTPNRIADSQNRARQYPQALEHPSPSFSFAQAKLRALTQATRTQRQQELQAILAQGKKHSATEAYEYALIQRQAGNLKTAASISETLLKDNPEAPHLIALQALIELDQGKASKAAERLQQALLILPRHPQLTTLYAEALLQTDQAKVAADRMRQMIQQQSQFVLPSYYQLLAKAEFAGDRPGNAYMALADYYYMIGQGRTAIDQLEKALEQSDKNNSFQQQRIEAELERLKQEVLEQNDNERQSDSP
jgi:predicted Zn-dependent protease